ncbi:MAG: DNA mismatch repair endonuclease MutL, partial [Clostridiales bacterium]|jgi:DNA mismatch repair protein MutL|nr:DNA mismatch repair endonuclease MutL [Clostridiales bacterium]
MITKTVGAMAGTRVEVHGGKLISSKEIGCADGTTIIVSNLFYNTPARRKFLKKPATEAGYIAHCLERLALGNPGLVLRYINNGQIVFQTTGNGDLKTAMLNVYGRETAANTATVDAVTMFESGETRLCGLIGKPVTARGNRRHGSFFINGRYIESRLVANAIESAMKTMLPSGKFPIYALSLTLPPDTLDVNVHPTKMDVRFADEESIFAFIENSVRDALEEHNLIPSVSIGRKPAERPVFEPEVEQISLQGGLHGGIARQSRNIGGFIPAKIVSASPPPSAFLREEKFSLYEENLPEEIPEKIPEKPPEDIFFTNYQIHGIIFQTYWLVTQGESLFMIDQHAAHERVLYENILCNVREESIHAQSLLMPILLRLTPMERQVLCDNKQLFARFGFEISDETENPEILSVPFLMKGPLSSAFFTELLDKMGEVGFDKDSPYTHKTEIIAMAACKAAVKAGDIMGEDEARKLIEQLLQLSNPFTCPHGRPTIIEITRSELERRFKR